MGQFSHSLSASTARSGLRTPHSVSVAAVLCSVVNWCCSPGALSCRAMRWGGRRGEGGWRAGLGAEGGLGAAGGARPPAELTNKPLNNVIN